MKYAFREVDFWRILLETGLSKVFHFGPRAPQSDIVKGQRLFEVVGLNECFNEGDVIERAEPKHLFV